MKIDKAITDAIAKVRLDSAPEDFAVVGHQTLDPEEVSLVASGPGGFEDMMKSFDATKVSGQIM